jgi:hypothetical protein
MGLLGNIRKALYSTAKTLGDVQAVKKGKVVERVKNRIVGKLTGKLLKRL